MIMFVFLLALSGNVLAQWFYPFYYPPMGFVPWAPQMYYNYVMYPKVYNPFGRSADSPLPIEGDWKLKSVIENGATRPGSEEWRASLKIEKADAESYKEDYPDIIAAYTLVARVRNTLSGPLFQTASGWKNVGYISSQMHVRPDSLRENEDHVFTLLESVSDVKLESDELVLQKDDQTKLVFSRETA